MGQQGCALGILHYLWRKALEGDLLLLRRYSEEGSVRHSPRVVKNPALFGLKEEDLSGERSELKEGHHLGLNDAGYHFSKVQCKIVSSRIFNLGKRLLADFRNPVKVAQWRICVALGFGGRKRVPSSVEKRSSVPVLLQKALYLLLLMESDREGGFSDDFFYTTEYELYTGDGLHVCFEVGFVAPPSLLEVHLK